MGDNNIKKRVFDFLIFDIKHIDLELLQIYSNFFSESLISHLTSRPDLSSEAFFWRRLYHQFQIEQPNEKIYPREENTKTSIKIALKELEKKFHESIYCLECGCGPVSQFYTNDFLNNSDIKIVTVDPLAEVFEKIHERYQTGYDLVCIPGYGENLEKLFPKDYFHLVYSQNAIDHSQNPKEFLHSLSYVLKPQGYLILHGFIKEGTAANWLGLHKWDIETNGDDLLLSNRDRTIKQMNLTNDLNLNVFCKSVTGQNIGDRYTIIFEKKGLNLEDTSYCS